MSKSLNLFLPALGGAALVLGVAYGISTRNFRADEAELAMARAIAAEERAGQMAAEMAELTRQIAQIREEAQATQAAPSLTAGAPADAAPLGLGRPAHPEEVAAWNVDVLPDGRGLPPGSGDVLTGEEVFADNCASCHGDFAEGVDNWPVLAGGFDTLADKDPVKTVGSYWPYLSTVWDYVHRSMPFGAAQTLSADDTYAIVAYILYSNDLVDEDFVLSDANFAEFEMYNRDGFVIDDRAEAEYALWRSEPCMTDCKDSVEITMHASVLDVTPEEAGAEASASGSQPAAVQVASAEATAETAPEAAEIVPASAPEPELVAQGEKVFKKCKACHAVGDGAKNKTGPQLNGLFGRVMGSVEGFRYSAGFTSAMEEGRVWTAEELAAFLTKPKDFMNGTKMSFAGLRKDEDQAAIAAYLQSFSN